MGLLVFTIGFASIGAIFTSLARSILVSKTKTLATNLAQEKIESLKDLSYYRLLVTTATTTDANFPGMVYDQGTTVSYYPEENLNVGGLKFKRRVLVEYVELVGNDLVGQSWTANDTGLKRVLVYVVWEESNEWKKVELANLHNNPNRAELNYSFTGTVTSATTTNALANVLVDTQQNPSYFARTDSAGVYSFKVSPGTYSLRASLPGYFTQVSSNFVVSAGQTGSVTRDFALTLMAQGQATGYAYLQNHLVIASIVTSYDNGGNIGQESVELYNPTTSQILIASRSTPGGSFDIFFVTVTWIDNNNAEPAGGNNSKYLLGKPGVSGSVFTAFRSSSAYWTIDTPTISIPSQSFFLISNYSTMSVEGVSVIADAYYTGTQANNSQMDDANAGGIRVAGLGGYSFNSRTDWQDGVGWLGGGSPSLAYESGPYTINPGAGDVLYRGPPSGYPDTPSRTDSPPAAHCYDTDNSQPVTSDGNWDEISIAAAIALSTNTRPRNADLPMPPGPCTPAVGASISANDGLSSVAYVQSYGSFTLVGMATGAWTVTLSSGDYTRDISTVTITPAISAGIPNNSTDPRSQFSNFPAIALTTASVYGYISGQVKDTSNNGLSGVTVSEVSASALTDSSGRYRLSVIPSGSPASVSASKTGYATEIVDNIGVSLGVNVSTINFILVSAGSIKGFITTNGTAALPGVPVVATDLSSTTIVGSAITDVNGSFTIPSVATGTYRVTPQLEVGETSSPENTIVTVVSNSTGTWSSTFTVTNAFGEIKGTVGVGSSTSPITTGVLLIASTAAITTENPPVFNSTLRSGTNIYYAGSSDAGGSYVLSLRGNATYYLYGWYPTTLSVSASSSSKKGAGTIFVGPGASETKDINW